MREEQFLEIEKRTDKHLKQLMMAITLGFFGEGSISYTNLNEDSIWTWLMRSMVSLPVVIQLLRLGKCGLDYILNCACAKITR